MDAAGLSNGLVLAGVLEVKRYLSTTGSGEEKAYLLAATAILDHGQDTFK
jgi:hypothetical protein